MRSLIILLSAAATLALPHALWADESSARTPAGTYDLLICEGACSFDTPANAVVKGRVVLFADALAPADLQRFHENRRRYHAHEAVNGCFTLERVGKSSIYAGIEKVGLTSWSDEGGRFRFSLYHSPDAGYEVTVQSIALGLSGTGTSWGAGAAAPRTKTQEPVLARRTGDAALSNCTFETPEEHEFRRLLADPVRE